jgi:hypothetical protein
MESTIVSFPWNPVIGTYVVAVESQPITDEYDLLNNNVNKTVQVIAAPAIEIAPTEFTFLVPTDSSDTDTLTITNLPTAWETLNYNILYDGDLGGSWISASPETGTVAVNDLDIVTITVDTTGLSEGNYQGFIIVQSNDLDDPELIATVNLTVVYGNDMTVISINSPTGTVPFDNYAINATVQNLGYYTQTGVVVNCTVMEGLFGPFLIEDFAGATFPPDGWSQEESGEWDQYDSNNAGGTAPEARLYWNNINGDYAYLDSVPVSTIGAPTLSLGFNNSLDHYSSTFNAKILVRSDSGSSWIDVTPWSNPVTDDISAAYNEVDITSAIGSDTQIRFEFDGDDYNLNNWYIDDIHIFSDPSRSPGDVVYSSEQTIDLDALLSTDIEFLPGWNADTLGFFAIQVETRLTGDQDTGNDIITAVVEIYEDILVPTISNVFDFPDPQSIGGNVNVSCEVFDESGLSDVRIDITGPAGFTQVNVSMTESEGGIYYYDIAYGIEGVYQYTIWSIDTIGNSITTSQYQFSIVDATIIIVDIDFGNGWNLITIPVNRTDYKASNLRENITSCQFISWFNSTSQQFETYTGNPESDFSILDGQSYLLYTAAGSTLTLVGMQIITVSVPINTGWNLIGWFNIDDTTASSIHENITGCQFISWFNSTSQQFETYTGNPDSDFIITQGMGLMLYTTTSSVWHGEG